VNRISISRFFLFALVNIAAIGSALCQPAVIAKTDTGRIKIGEQFKLDLSAVAGPGQTVLFPMIPDTFNHFEVVRRNPQDTIKNPNDKNLTLRLQLVLTAFDSGYFVLPPFSFVFKKGNQTDTLSTEAQLMNVVWVPVDTTKEIRDIKGVMDVPFPWYMILVYILLAYLITGAVIYIRKKLRKKPVVTEKKAAPALPPHEIALTELQMLEEEKLWQQGQNKIFHSRLSDIIRTYIENRFHIPALEHPTNDTLRLLGRQIIHEPEKEKLRYILELADMVKFAKAEPVSYENEQSIKYAFEFIMTTKPVEKTDIAENMEVEV
jgi:hypothetical protein